MSLRDLRRNHGAPPAEPAPALDPDPTPGAGGRGDLSRRAVVLIFLAVTLLAFARPLLGQGTFLAVDLLRQAPPWRAETPPGFRAHNAVLGDTIDAFAARERFWSEALDGDLWLWSDDIGGGTPVLPMFSVVAPFEAVRLVLPDWYAPGAEAALRLLAAMVLTYGLLRRLGAVRWAATLAGVGYGLTGFFGAWTNWHHTNVSVLLPGVFWAAEAIWQDPRARRAVPLALVLAAAILGSFPAVLVYGLYALAGYLVVRALSDRRPLREGGSPLARPLAAGAWVGAGGLLGLLLGAVHLLPFAELLGTIDLSYRERPPAARLNPDYLLTLISPNAFGNRYEVFWGPGSTWPEAVMYAGLAVLLLAGWALALPARQAASLRGRPGDPPRSVAGFFLGMVVVTTYTMVSGGPLTRVANQLPGMEGSFIGRTRVLVDLGLAVLAGLGAHAWHRYMTDEAGRAELGRRLRVVALGLAAAALVALVWSGDFLLDYAREASARGLGEYTATRFAVPLAAGAATLVLLAVAWRRPRTHRLVAAGLVVVVAADMLWFFVPINPVPPREQFYDRTPAHQFMADHLGQARMAGTGLAFYPNANILYGLPDVRGHTFYQPEYLDLVRTVHPKVLRTPTVITFPAGVDLGSPVLDLLGVRYWSEDERQPVRGRRLDGPAPTEASLDPAAGAATTRLRVPEGGLRAVELQVRRRPLSARRLTVEVLRPGGQLLASGERRLWTLQRNRWEQVVLAGDGLPAGAEVTLRVGTDEPAGRVQVAAAAAGPAHRLVAGRDDGLRVAFGAGVVVYERLEAQPLARLYGGYEVVTGQAAVARLATRPAAGRDRALVEAPVPGLPPGPGQGPPGTVAVRDWAAGDVRLEVDAARAGLLVLAVNDYPGWRATVDGRPAEIVRADHAFQGVAVPAGRHQVRLQYRPQSFRRGLALAGVGLVACALLWLVPAWRARGGRDRAAILRRRSGAAAGADRR